jgi:hypothetical protein
METNPEILFHVAHEKLTICIPAMRKRDGNCVAGTGWSISIFPVMKEVDCIVII